MIIESHKELNRLLEDKRKILNNIEEIKNILKCSTNKKTLNLLNEYYEIKSKYEIQINKVIQDLDLLYYSKDLSNVSKKL
jgi:hypothetical protein